MVTMRDIRHATDELGERLGASGRYYVRHNNAAMPPRKYGLIDRHIGEGSPVLFAPNRAGMLQMIDAAIWAIEQANRPVKVANPCHVNQCGKEATRFFINADDDHTLLCETCGSAYEIGRDPENAHEYLLMLGDD